MSLHHHESSDLPNASLAQNLAIAAGLGVIAAETFIAERTHFANELADPLGTVLESGGHPWFGFSAGLVCIAAMKGKLHPITKTKVIAGGVLTTALNFGAEISQELILDPKTSFIAHENRLETMKDWAFALSGLALVYMINRNRGKVANTD